MRAWRSASRPGRTTTRPPRRKTTPSTSTSGSPRVGSRTSADGCGGSRVTGSRTSTRPCSFSSSSERHGGCALDHLPDRRVLLLDLGALLVAQRLHVEHERLLDLGVVEEVAAALGGDLRMVRQDDRRPEHHVVLGRGEHRPGVHAVAGGVELGDEAAAVHAQHRMRRDQRVAKRLAAPEAVRHLGAVLDPVRDSAVARPPAASRLELRAHAQSADLEVADALDALRLRDVPLTARQQEVQLRRRPRRRPRPRSWSSRWS